MKKGIVTVVVAIVWLGSLYFAYGFGALFATFRPELSDAARTALSVMTMLPAGSANRPCAVDDPTTCGFADTEGRRETACEAFAGDAPHRAVLFAFGQSNSANAARDRYVPVHEIVNFNVHDGKCYRAEDPLLGPDGSAGAVWGRVADELVHAGLYRQVLIVPIGIGGTELARWAPGGDLHVRVETTAAMLAGLGIRPTHVVWHQGESDVFAGTPTEEYVTRFSALAASLGTLGIDAPVFPAVATRCYFQDAMEAEYADSAGRIRAAQERLPEEIPNVFPGPDTDTIAGDRFRPDGCHFTARGIAAQARLWVEALQAAGTM